MPAVEMVRRGPVGRRWRGSPPPPLLSPRGGRRGGGGLLRVLLGRLLVRLDQLVHVRDVSGRRRAGDEPYGKK